MKIKFWLFAAIFSVAGLAAMTSCGNDEPPVILPIDPVTKEPSAEDFEFINKWVDSYMKSHYLWNEEYKTLRPNYEQKSKPFLEEMLKGVENQNNVNEEDGYWIKGKREQFYSYINYHADENATRDVPKKFGFGFTGIQTGYIEGQYFFGILGVVPDSPADKAGLTRGMFISKMDGKSLTDKNITANYKLLFPSKGSTIKFELCTKRYDDNGQIVTEGKTTKTMSTSNYDNNPIVWAQLILSKTDANLKAGYVAYNSFEVAYDENLIGFFADMTKQAGGQVSDLILDLRYNQGGYLRSSLLLSTLVVGNDYKDGLFCKTIFNKERMEKLNGVAQEFRIGNKNIAEIEGSTYPLIEAALSAAVNLKRVYVLTGTYTASASELLISGLRGLGVDVRIVGQKTLGKNVGMEGLMRGYNDFVYDFAPITFHLENATGDDNYFGGFVPDVDIYDANTWLLSDYGSGADPLLNFTLQWIQEGVKPVYEPQSVAAKNRASQVVMGETYLPAPDRAGTYIGM